MMITSVIAFALLTQSHSAPKPKMWFMYFVKGAGKRPEDTAELERMQKGHIANLGEQYAKGHLVAAGPVDDPAKTRRGITVIRAVDRAECLSFFKTDPYVSAHIMEVAVAEWDIKPERFAAPSDLNKMTEYRIISLFGPLSKGERSSLSSLAVGGALKLPRDETFKFPTEVWLLESGKEAGSDRILADRVRRSSGSVEKIALYMSPGLLAPKG